MMMRIMRPEFTEDVYYSEGGERYDAQCDVCDDGGARAIYDCGEVSCGGHCPL